MTALDAYLRSRDWDRALDEATAATIDARLVELGLVEALPPAAVSDDLRPFTWDELYGDGG